MLNIAIMGFGTIGSGVFDVVNTNQAVLKQKLGENVNVKYVLDLRTFPGNPVESVLVHDVDVIMQDPEVKVVVETMGGVKPAFEFVSKALAAGKHVATSNKELVEKKGTELMALAREHNVNFFFGASVGGGIPIIRPLRLCLNAEQIDEISGIFNGTTNYILTEMLEKQTSFADALANAQELGYAERNPEADIEGHDVGRKVAILSSIVLGKKVNFDDLHVEGISKITTEDIAYATEMDCRIKLLGDAKIHADGTYTGMVAPFLVKPENPLYSVMGVFNAIKVHGNMVDDVMFYGRGAGSHATASAVVADVIEAGQNQDRNVFGGWADEVQKVESCGSNTTAFLVRVSGGSERTAELEQLFGAGTVLKPASVQNEIGYVTPVMSEKEFEEKSAQLAGLIGRIRIK